MISGTQKQDVWPVPAGRLHMDAVILAKFINGMNFRKSVRPLENF